MPTQTDESRRQALKGGLLALTGLFFAQLIALLPNQAEARPAPRAEARRRGPEPAIISLKDWLNQAFPGWEPWHDNRYGQGVRQLPGFGDARNCEIWVNGQFPNGGDVNSIFVPLNGEVEFRLVNREVVVRQLSRAAR